MPYRTNRDLPKGAKTLPSFQQSAFRKIFNACVASGKKESTCFPVAYSGAEKAGKKAKGDG